MDSKKILSNVTIKTEPNTSTTKKVLLSSSPLTQLANKTLSTTRLASFKPPRDLLLTGSTTSTTSALNLNSGVKSTRRTFMPNINVTRKKGISETITNDAGSEVHHKGKSREKDKKPLGIKKRNAKMIQTKGVFSEGLAPEKMRAFSNAFSQRAFGERQVMDKPKLNLNKKFIKSDEDSKLKTLLKDDFTDDPSLVPDINFKPNSLPLVYNVKKPESQTDLEKTFEMLQVKMEKRQQLNLSELKNERSDMVTIFEKEPEPKLLLFEFPSILECKNGSEKKKNTKGQQIETEKQNDKSEDLSSLGEGFLGYLRIHENGKAYFVIGSNLIPLCFTRHGTRQEIMSTSIDTEKSRGEVISLGTVDASFTCSANFFQDVS